MQQYAARNDIFIALNRFGYGPTMSFTPHTIKDPKAWLISGLTTPQFQRDLPNSVAVWQALAEYRRLNKQAKANKKVIDPSHKKALKKRQLDYFDDSTLSVLNSEHTVNWRLLDFFSNHFSVTGNNIALNVLAPTLEREAIAPNVLGSFADLLVAVAQHPAMLIYLNNERSFGPNSKMGKRKKGLNENLAREILELHTLGVDGGYSQQDVLELAKGITGWSVANPAKEPNQGFVFRKNGHEPGERVLLGQGYKQRGIKQGEAMLRDLAQHPATAKFICTKLAKHFVADEPKPDLVTTMIDAWQKTQGNIKSVMTALIQSEAAWLPQAEKYKTPRDFVLSAFRLVAPNKVKTKHLISALRQLGQAPFNAGSPAGYPDDEKAWLGASALVNRIDISAAFASRYKLNAEQAMALSLGNTVSELTYKSVIRAESRNQAATLFLLSPEFQRR